MKKFLLKVICVMLLGAMSLPASADKEDLTQYRYIPVEAMEDALLYELKPFAATYIEAGKQYGVLSCQGCGGIWMGSLSVSA